MYNRIFKLFISCIFFCLFIFLTSGFSFADNSVPCNASNWTRQSPYETGTIYSWTFNGLDPVYEKCNTSPAIGSDGTIYTYSNESVLYALNPDGTIKWKIKIANDKWNSTSAIVGQDNTIYVCGKYLNAINPDGSIKWSSMTEFSALGTPSIGPDGNIYLGAKINSQNCICSINPEGEINWYSYVLVAISRPLSIGPDGLIYGNDSYYLTALDSTGNIRWGKSISGIIGTSAIGNDGTIYIAKESGGVLSAIKPDGTTKWTINEGLVSSPTIDLDGTIYVGSSRGLLSINPEGLSKVISDDTGKDERPPVIGSDGTIYYSGLAINKDGSAKLVGGGYGTPIISKDGGVYYGNRAITFYAYFRSDISQTNEGKAINFDAAESVGDIIAYTWDFGDGTTGSGKVVSHVYNKVGYYKITLTVTVKNGLLATYEDWVEIELRTDIEEFYSKSSFSDFDITLNPETYDMPPIIIGHHSDEANKIFGDGKGYVNTDLYIEKRSNGKYYYKYSTDSLSYPTDGSWIEDTGFVHDGEVVIKVYSKDRISAWDLNGINLKVHNNSDLHIFIKAYNDSPNFPRLRVDPNFLRPGWNIPLVSKFNNPGTIKAGEGVKFDGSESYGDITSYLWDFGDGTTGKGKQASHIYSRPGNYNVTLYVKCVDGATVKSSQLVTVTENIVTEINGPQQKEMFTNTDIKEIKADNVEILPDGKKKYEGNISINSYLKINGTLIINPESSEITGDGLVYLESNNARFHGQINLFKGQFSLNGETGELLKNSGLDKLQVAGIKVQIDSLRLIINGIKIAGNLELPDNVGGASVAFDNLQIIDGKIDFTGKVSLPDLILGKSSLGLKDGYMEFDTEANKFAGHAILEIPKLFGIEGKVGIENAKLNEVGFGLDGTNIAIDASGFFVTRIYGEVGGLSLPPLKITGAVDISGGPKIADISAIEGEDLSLTVDLSGSVNGSGNLNLFGYDLSSASFSIDHESGFYVAGSINAFDIIEANTEFTIDKQQKFRGIAKGTIKVPDQLPYLGGEILQETNIDINNEGLKAGIRLGLSSLTLSMDWNGNCNIDNLTLIDRSKTSLAYKQIDSTTFNIPEGTDQVLVRLTWEGNPDTYFTLANPHGEEITPGNATEDSLIANYFKNPNKNEAYYILADPYAGTWTYSISDPNVIANPIEINIVKAPPTFTLINITPNDTEIDNFDIEWSINAKPGCTLDLYFSDNPERYFGTPIVAGIDPIQTSKYTWDTSLISSGQYYLFACIKDGVNALVYSAPELVNVNNIDTPQAPDGLYLSTSNGDLSLSWSANTESDLKGFKIYFLDDEGNLSTFELGSETNFIWEGLETNKYYTGKLTAIDNQGLESMPAEFGVYLPSPVPPVMKVVWPSAVTNSSEVVVSGTIERYATVSIYVNNNEIVNGLTGTFSFKVSLVEDFNNEIKVVGIKQDGDTSEQSFNCYSDSTAPQLTVDNIYDGMEVTAAEITITGTVEPSATLTLNGNQVTTISNNKYTAELILETGLNTAQLVATDMAGNVTIFNGNIEYKDSTIPTGFIDNFIIDRDGQMIIVPLDGIDGYAFAYSTENELYQYLKGSNNYPVVYGIQSGDKYMHMGGLGGYAMNFSIYPTPLEAMENTETIPVEILETYYVFNGFDSSGNSLLTLWSN
jgi:PKD repeat protein